MSAQRVAVCLAGEVRSLREPVTRRMFAHNFWQPDYALFLSVEDAHSAAALAATLSQELGSPVRYGAAGNTTTKIESSNLQLQSVCMYMYIL